MLLESDWYMWSLTENTENHELLGDAEQFVKYNSAVFVLAIQEFFH